MTEQRTIAVLSIWPTFDWRTGMICGPLLLIDYGGDGHGRQPCRAIWYRGWSR